MLGASSRNTLSITATISRDGNRFEPAQKPGGADPGSEAGAVELHSWSWTTPPTHCQSLELSRFTSVLADMFWTLKEKWECSTMWLFGIFNLFYVFCITFLPVILDTGLQVDIWKTFLTLNLILAPGVERDKDTWQRLPKNSWMEQCAIFSSTGGEHPWSCEEFCLHLVCQFWLTHQVPRPSPGEGEHLSKKSAGL